MQRFQFGPFQLDAADHLLSHDGKPLSIPPKAFDTLAYLVRNCKRLVTRDELIKAIWPDSFVEDGSLSVNISLVRRILGEMDGGEPYIETVPRLGYRFRSEVVALEDELLHVSSQPAVFATLQNSAAGTAVAPARDSLLEIVRPVPAHKPGDAIARNRSGRLPRALKYAFVLAATGLIALGWISTKLYWTRSAPFASMRITRLASQRDIADAVISPDGKYVAYVISEAQGQSLWVRQTAGLGNVRTVDPMPARYSGLTFSPEGNDLYYVRVDKNGVRGLYRMPFLGGASVRLLTGILGPISFSPSGKQFAFVRMDPANWEATVAVTEADGAGIRQIARRKRPRYFSPNGVAWSADGRFIFCFGGEAPDYVPQAFKVLRVRVADGAEEAVTSKTWTWAGSVARAVDGKNLLVTASEDAEEALQIWRISLSGGPVSKVTNDLSNYAALSLATGGKTLASVQSNRSAELWVAPGDDFARSAPISATNIESLNSLSWTADGEIAYSARSAGFLSIFLTNSDGHNLKQLTMTASDRSESSVTPDNRYVLFQSGGKIWRMDRDGTHVLQLTRGAHDVHPYPTPDSRSVIYASFARWSPSIGGKPTLWSVPIEGGQARQLTDLPTSFPQVSSDGRWIAAAYFPGDDPRFSPNWMALFSSTGGAPLKVFSRPPSASDFLHWSPDGKAFDFVVTNEGVSNIWRQALAGGPPAQLTRFKADEIFDFAWSPNGREMALSRGRLTSSIVLLKDADR